MRHAFVVLSLVLGTTQCARSEIDEGPPAGAAPAPIVASDAPAAVKVPIEGLPAFGSRDALVTLVAFVDHDCPYCARAAGTIDALRAAYGDRLRVVVASRPLPIHPGARDAAIAFLAADRLGKGEAMHARLLEGKHPIDADVIHAHASALGLDREAFDAARAELAARDALRTSETLAAAVGAEGTPTFFVNGRRIVGAQPLATFRALVDEELASAERLVARGVRREDVYRTLVDRAPAYVRRASTEPDVVVPVATEGAPSRGPERAPVSIVVFSDFECPFCVRLEETLRAVEAARPRSVRVVWKQRPLPMHEHARLAAKASVAAQAQGRFWEYHDVLVAHRDALDASSLVRHAQTAGLDVARFVRELEDPHLDARVAADEAQADALGVKGTPTSFVNGRRVVGAQPLDTWLAMVDRALADAR